MSEIELSDGFFQKTAGWEAVQHARALLASGRVLSSNWTPPVLKGVVQGGDTSYRSGLVIRGIADIDNLCTCRPSREDGILCAHSVAVGLHHLKGQSPAAAGASVPGTPVRKAPPAERTREPVRLKRAEDGAPLSLHVILPPNLSEALSRGRAQLVFEGQSARGRAPLNSLISGGPFHLAEDDLRLLDAAEALAGGDTPGMLQLSVRDFLGLLPTLAGHPRLTLG
ncbi:MAG: hypothetical protein KIT22_19925, partial [Verrucomicrobiae bacterium]|nr:hypothetical protein [Verrucomicrobiae bacterium]